MNKIYPVILSAFGPPALACLRSWGRAGMTPGMICIQDSGDPKPASKYLADSICLSREDLYNDRGLNSVTQFLGEFGASGLTCIDENIAQWLNKERFRLPDGVALWLPPNEMLHRVLDKVVQIEVARQVGLNVLPTYLFDGNNLTDEITDDHFPLCLRPSAPDSISPSFKVKNVESAQQLSEFLCTLTIRKPVIGQPFKNLPNLVVHGTRTADGESIGLTAFVVERKFQGVTLTLRQTTLTKDLKALCLAFTETMNLVGHYHFEFLADPASGENLFLEINHRFGGTTAKALVCGYQEPLYALQAQGVAVAVPTTVKSVTVSSIKALCKSALYALTGRLTPLDYPEEPKIKLVWSTVKCLALCRDEVFAWDDLQGTAAFYLGDIPARMKQAVARCRRLLPPIKDDSP